MPAKPAGSIARGVALVAAVKLLAHLATNNTLLGYGYFRDEFYFLACAERLAWGYVDHPPLSMLLLAASRSVFGDSLFALRLVPAVAGALTVLVTGLMTRHLGGGRFAQVLAALAATFAPILLIVHGFFSINAIEVLLWTLTSWVLVVLLGEDRPRLWLLVGVLMGLGLQTKHTTVVFGLGIAVGLLLTQARRFLAGRWVWLGGALALLILLPNVAWQAAHGWPSLEFYASATENKNVATLPIELLLT